MILMVVMLLMIFIFYLSLVNIEFCLKDCRLNVKTVEELSESFHL